MKQSQPLALKGESVEEWADLHFFRPLGARLARSLERTRFSPDDVTLWCVFLGLLAGHLMVYRSVGLNLLGAALFVASDVLDSADGQLARLRGTSSRFGRMLDGVSDAARFLNLYAHLLARVALGHAGWHAEWVGAMLVIAALISHSLQAQVVDFVRNAYLRLGTGGGGELDLPEDLAPVRGTWVRQLASRLYGAYVNRQAWLFPRTTMLLRVMPPDPPEGFQREYAALQAPLLPALAVIGQNIRFVMLAITAFMGVRWFLFVTLIPLNVVMLVVLIAHERNADVLSAQADAVVQVSP